MQYFKNANWLTYLTDWQIQLIEVTDHLIQEYDKQQDSLEDYSFLVFPMSKAYEGFLKKFLYDLSLIDQATYEGHRFRIGRALNPDVAKEQRDEYWLYDNIVKICSLETARQLWKAWLKCRNRVFHFFPKDKGLLTYEQALSKIDLVSRAMSVATKCYYLQHQRDQ